MKKAKGIKAQIKAEKERERKIATALFYSFLLIIAAISAYFIYTFLIRSSEPHLIEPSFVFKPETPNPQLKAAIIDHLSLTAPNESFRDGAAAILVDANYTVDYFSGEKVTVELYRALPLYGYRLIILRVHSAVRPGTQSLALFTSEPYSKTKYVQEQLADQVGIVAYNPGDEKLYFGVSIEFIRSCMKGNFQNATIIMMGCNGLQYTPIAEAFLWRGAKAYIGWNASISASHTDKATAILLEQLITKRQTIRVAIEKTMKEMIDLPSNVTLTYFPLTVADQHL